MIERMSQNIELETAAIEQLHGMISDRPTPEAVAAVIFDTPWFNDLPLRDQIRIERLSDGVRRFGAVSMPNGFQKHEGLAGPYLTANRLVNAIAATAGLEELPLASSSKPDEMLNWVLRALELLHMDAPHMMDRMNSEQLSETLPGVSSRAYRKACRAVLHLRERAVILRHRRALERSVEFGKTRLASTIALEDLAGAPMTASFIAYYVARLSRRTLFAVGSQSRPADDISEALLKPALAEGRAHVLARVITRQSVLRSLSQEEAKHLLSEYTDVLYDTADQLEGLFDSGRRRSPMVVRRGDDSSAWNAAALAFNQARTGILNLSTVLPELRYGLDRGLPGKVPSLVAADLMRWYDHSGTPLQDDSSVFADLPLPWDVVLHNVECTRKMVEEACAKHGLEPEATGWTQPYRQAEIEESQETPTSLHGVVIPSAFAGLRDDMRRAGWFSGK